MMLFLPPALVQTADQASKTFEVRCAEYSKAKDWKGLEAFARDYAAVHPDNAASRAALGYALFAQGRLQEGREACEAALNLDSKCREAYLYLGMQAAAAGDSAGALARGQQLDKAIPGAGMAYFRIPAIFCALGTDPSVLCLDISAVKVILEPARPPYPEAAKSAHIQGSVLVDLTVGPDGVPTVARALCGPTGLRNYCEQYCLEWRFAPVQKEGKPTSVRLALVLNLRLSDGTGLRDRSMSSRGRGR